MVHVHSVIAFAMLPLLIAASPIQNLQSRAVAKNAAPKGQNKALPPTGAKAQGKASPPAGPGKQNKASAPTGPGKQSKSSPSTGKGNSKNNKSGKSSPAKKAPDHLKGLPKNTHMLAWDEKNHKLIAFDKNKKQLTSVKAVGGTPGKKAAAGKGAKGGKSDSKKPATGGNKKPGNGGPKPASSSQKASTPATPKKAAKTKRDGGGSTALSSDDVQKLPGWSTLKSTAEKNWGTGSYNVVTNDKDYPDMPALVSVDTATAMIVKDPKMNCKNDTIQANGTLSNGSITGEQEFGTDYSSTFTVTKESSLSVGASVTATVGIEDIVDVSATATFETKFTNTLAQSTTASSHQSNKLTITSNLNGGQSCLWIQTSHCDITGKGKVRYLASGWVWFEYNDQTQGHYKWALNIDSVVTNQDDRSSFMEFKAAVSSKTTAQFTDKCK